MSDTGGVRYREVSDRGGSTYRTFLRTPAWRRPPPSVGRGVPMGEFDRGVSDTECFECSERGGTVSGTGRTQGCHPPSAAARARKSALRRLSSVLSACRRACGDV